MCPLSAPACPLAPQPHLTTLPTPALPIFRAAGELCKFRCFPFGSAFSQLKTLLDDFAGHNIDAACALVETAGRFFYR